MYEIGPDTVYDTLVIRKMVRGIPPYFVPASNSVDDQRALRNRYGSQIIHVVIDASAPRIQYTSFDGLTADPFGGPQVIGQPASLKESQPIAFIGTGYLYNIYPEVGVREGYPSGIPNITFTHGEGGATFSGRSAKDLGDVITHKDALRLAWDTCADYDWPVRTEPGGINPITGLPVGWNDDINLRFDEFQFPGDSNVDVRLHSSFSGQLVQYLESWPTIYTGSSPSVGLVSGWFQKNVPSQSILVQRARPRFANPTPYFLANAAIFSHPVHGFIVGDVTLRDSGVAGFYSPVEIPLPDVNTADPNDPSLELPIDLTRESGHELGYGRCTFMITNETPEDWSARTGIPFS